MSNGLVTIGALKRLSTYLAGQLKSAVSITGGAIDGVSIGTTTSATSIKSTGYYQTQVTTETTATNLSAVGESIVASTGGVSSFTMSAPSKGAMKFIRCSASTAASNVLINTGIQIADNATQTVLNIGGKCTIGLIAESSTVWALTGGWQSSLVTLSS